MIHTIKSTHGTLNMTSRRLSCQSCRRRLVRAGRRCAPSWVDADETWSSTGALDVMAAALPARAGLRYLLTAVRQALKHRSCWLDKPGLLQKVVRTVRSRSVVVAVHHTRKVVGLALQIARGAGGGETTDGNHHQIISNQLSVRATPLSATYTPPLYRETPVLRSRR